MRPSSLFTNIFPAFYFYIDLIFSVKSVLLLHLPTTGPIGMLLVLLINSTITQVIDPPVIFFDTTELLIASEVIV